MKRFFSILFCLCISSISFATVFNDINVDVSTINAMTDAYALEAQTEQSNLSSYSNIREHYVSGELATAGIFASKYLDQKAMREVSCFGTKQENFYYQRIRTLVKDMIMPKIWDVGKLMVEHPDKALYWGPYLIKTCDEVKLLCMEFETVVTNGKCSFSDIEFLVVNDKIRQVLDLAKFGNIDWNKEWDDFSNCGSQITLDNIKEDLTKFLANCSTIASAGLNVVSDEWANSSSSGNSLIQKPRQLAQTYEKFKSVYDDFQNTDKIKNLILSRLETNGKISLSNLFSVDEYNITSMLSDYLHEVNGQYYTQNYYIYREDNGSTVLCDYTPTSYAKYDDDRWSSAWLQFVSPRDDIYCHSLTSDETSTLREKAESNSGWSTNKVNAYNNSHPGHHATISYSLVHIDIDESYKHGWGGRHHKRHCFYSYSIKVVDSWGVKNQVYSAVFDSYSMAQSVFDAQMTEKLNYYEKSEDGYIYSIGHDDKVYYSATDATKVRGIASVSFILSCANETNMGEGNISWKENGDQGSSLGENSKVFAMETSLKTNTDEEKLKAKIDEMNSQISSYQSQLATSNSRYNYVIQQMTTPAGYKSYYNEYVTISSTIKDLKSKISESQTLLNEYKDSLSQLNDDEAETKDATTRIPSIMHTLQYSYNLNWLDEGHWDGFTFVRTAHLGNLDGTVTFSATLSLARKPKHFLGIRIHRAILAVAWSLKSNSSSKDVVESFELDKSKSDEENSKIVNDKASEIARAHPGCSVNIEYYKVAGTDSSDIDNSIHLLWIDDRLEVARRIESRLSKIYTQLVMVEKYMTNEKSLLSQLKDAVWDGVSAYKRGSIASDALAHWMSNAKSVGNNKQNTSSK